MTALIVSLFSGVGGLDIAVERVTGGRVVAHVENDPAASVVLKHHWPSVPNLGDATQVDWAPWVGKVDVVCAGFSCQDISGAGKQAGITEETRSGITWGATARAVRALRPRLVMLENVGAILVRGLDVVAADLAALGYDLRWTCLRASDVGAPHRRERWFVVAHPAGEGPQGLQPAQRRELPARSGRPAVADTDGGRREQRDAGQRGLSVARAGVAHAVAWGDYGPAVARWERLTGIAAPTPTDGGKRLSPDFVEWMVGLPVGWTDVGISRAQRLWCLGNIAMPMQAHAAYSLLLHDLLAAAAA